MAGTNGRLTQFPTIYDGSGRPIDLASMRANRQVNQGDGRWLDGMSGDEERFDGMDLPEPMTFAALYRGAAHTYLHQWDEAMKHNRVNALAMRRDCWLMSLLAERVDDTLSKQWHLECDNPRDPWQKSVVDGMTTIFKSTPHLKSMMRYMLHGRLWYGRYGANLKWVWDTMYVPKVQGSGIEVPGTITQPQFEKKRVLRVQKHKPVNGDKINFHYDDTPYVQLNAGWSDKLRGRPEVIYPPASGAAALLLRGTWREQVFISEYDPDDADFFEAEMAAGVHGVGIRSRIYWLDFMRRDYISWVTESLERIGLGLVVIYYDASNAEAKKEAMTVAKTYSRRAAIVMPRSPDSSWTSGSVEVVEAPTAGAQIVLSLQKHIEDQIERYVIGQTMSAGSDNASKLGGSGEAQFAADTKSKRCRFDADDFADSLTGSDVDPSPLSVIKKWNYPFADFPVRFVYDHEHDDPAKKMESIKTCVDMGVSFPESRVRELTGIPAPQEGDDIIGGKEALALEQMANMATGGVIGKGKESDNKGGVGKEDNINQEPPDVQYAGTVPASDTPPKDGLIRLPDIRQPDTFSCGACATMGVAEYFGVKKPLAEWKKDLGTSKEKSTDPEKIVECLKECGLGVSEEHGMSLADIKAALSAGKPVICPIKEYDTKETSEKYGHYVCAVGAAMGMVFVQDPSIDNVLEGEDADQVPGIMPISEERWEKVWHDTLCGREYHHYGIVVSPKTEDYAVNTGRPEEEQAVDLHVIIERIRRMGIGKEMIPQLVAFLNKSPHLARRLPASDLAYLKGK